MIAFDKQNEIFYLHTRTTTYSMGIFKGKLLHLYWGERLTNPINAKCTAIYKRKNMTAYDCDEYSSNCMPLEYSTYGSADLRLPSFNAVHSDGSRIAKLEYCDFKIVKGKPPLEGLPATYCEKDDSVETLIIHLNDKLKDIDVYLSYSVFEELNAITRSVKIVNNGDKLYLDTALSASVDFYGMPESDIIHLDGAWARERHITRRRIVYGNQCVDSKCGASSAYHNPFIAVCEKDASENQGNVYGFSLVYSGNFTAGLELDAYNCGRAYIGINPFDFEYLLEKGEVFQTPEAVLTYSSEGIGGMSRIYHRLYRTRLCRGKYRDTERFVLINNWEATYFDFDEDKIIDIAKKASEIGIDTMVLDDGWFGERTSDKAGLGDWYENPDRLPNGLKGLAEKVNSMGMRFGLWFEPEMVNPDSNLYRNHPDWVLHTKGRVSSLARNQLTLDLSRKDVCEYIIASLSSVLNKANIEYVKWDMNRYMTEVGSSLLSAERQGEVMHRYILGLYYVLETITKKFPNVLFESCASGGSRFDPGMLYYMPQTWTSDDTDAIERLKIQYGTSIVYPYSAMGAHVSVCPNHQVSRTTPFEMRCNVAMMGQFGFELDLNKCTENELETAKQAIKKYRELQGVFHRGECYRLKSPFETDLSVIEFIGKDKKTVILCINSVSANPNSVDEFIRLEGLDIDACYECENDIYGGDYLMNQGMIFRNDEEHRSVMLIFKKIESSAKL